MKKLLLKIFYSIFTSKKKEIYFERDEIKMSMLVHKNELSDEDRILQSEKIFSRIEKMNTFQSSKRILFYWSKELDVLTQDYILKWSEKKEIFLPSVKGDKLRIKQFLGIQQSSKNSSYKFEPKTCAYDGNIDLVIVPAVAFDGEKHRMGQGKGYYNHFFRFKNVYKIGVGFDFQVIEKIPDYWQDAKLDIVVTPNKIIS